MPASTLQSWRSSQARSTTCRGRSRQAEYRAYRRTRTSSCSTSPTTVTSTWRSTRNSTRWAAWHSGRPYRTSSTRTRSSMCTWAVSDKRVTRQSRHSGAKMHGTTRLSRNTRSMLTSAHRMRYLTRPDSPLAPADGDSCQTALRCRRSQY